MASAVRGSLGPLLILAFASKSLAFVVSTWKWDILLRGIGISEPRWSLLRLYTIGVFTSAFLPGVIGGDFVRWHLFASRVGRRAEIAATIVTERATGAVVLVLLSLPAATLALPVVGALQIISLLGVSLAVLSCTLGLALNRRLVTVTMYRTRRREVGRLFRPLYKVHRAFRSLPPRSVLAALAVSVIFYLSVGLTFFLLCRAFEADLTFVQAAAVQILINLLVLLPITLGGLGLAQVGDIYLFGLLGIDATLALSISLGRVFISYGYVLIGALFFLQWKKKRSRPAYLGMPSSELEPGVVRGLAKRGRS